MFRGLVFIFKFGLVSALVILAAMQSGMVELRWNDYLVRLDLGLFIIGGLAVLFTALFLHRIYLFVMNLPGRVRDWQEQRNRQRGMQALARGLAAVAAGDVRRANKEARRAAENLPETFYLVLFLQAQAARMAGRDAEARTYLTRLSQDKDAGFLGVRALLQAALNDGSGDHKHIGFARRLARHSLKSYGASPWLLQLSYKLALHERDWDEALMLLDSLAKYEVLPSEDLRSERAALLMAKAESLPGDHVDAKNRLLEKAHKVEKNSVPLVLALAEMYVQAGARKKAKSLLEKSWKDAPHPALAHAWGSVLAEDKARKPMARVKWFEKLLKLRADHYESYLAMGRAALDEGLWGEAREYLMQARAMMEAAQALDARVFKLLAALERRQNQNESAAQEWLVRAGQVKPDEAWICRETGREYSRWSPIAEPHGSFNTIMWSRPTQIDVTIRPLTGRDEYDVMGGLLAAE
jgi:HemY protein